MSPSCPTFFPQTLQCSGRGTCISNNTCSCTNSDFTGHADFFTGQEACDINKPAVTVLWSFLAVFHSVVMIYAIRYLKFKITTIREGRGFFFTTHVFLGFCALASSACFVALGILRASRVEETIGTAPGVTALFFAATSIFWFFAVFYTFEFVKLNVLQAKVKTEDTRRIIHLTFQALKIAMPVILFVAVVTCALPLGMLASTDPVVFQKLATGHYVLSAVVMVIEAPILVTMLSPIIADIRDASAITPATPTPSESETKLSALLARLVHFRGNLLQLFVGNLLFAGLFGFWPYLQRQSSLFLPFAWMSAAITLVDSLNTLNPSTRTGGSRNAPSNTNKSSSFVTGDQQQQQQSAAFPISPTASVYNDTASVNF